MEAATCVVVVVEVSWMLIMYSDEPTYYWKVEVFNLLILVYSLIDRKGLAHALIFR